MLWDWPGRDGILGQDVRRGVGRCLSEMRRPRGERRSGIRHPLQLTSGEARALSGRKALKYRPSLRPEQCRLPQPELIETQKVLQ